MNLLPELPISLLHCLFCFQLVRKLHSLPFCPQNCLEIGAFPLSFFNAGRHGEERRVIVGKGVGKWRGQVAIMVCGCDGGWDSGDVSLKSVFAQIRAMNHSY
jgi:hypothetical protein